VALAPSSGRPKRFYSLDVLRGFAALSVVFWHWQHFFGPGTGEGAFQPREQPWLTVFYPFYEHGWLAVSLFFSLSGFIFYWLYSGAIREKTVTARNFIALRFSRLYPLHAVTLLAVVAGQATYHALTSDSFVYAWNDPWHFLLNVFFASSWGLERGYSWNGPTWSISVEVILYAAFFILCRRLPVRLYALILLSIAGYFILGKIYEPIGKGIGAFFLGGAAYLLYERIVKARAVKKVLTVTTPALAVLWILTLATRNAWLASLPTILRPFKTFEAFTALVLFPATILFLALLETQRGKLGKRLAFVGDLSYSSYLIHFPLQLAFFCATTALAVNKSIYYSPVMLVVFFVVLIALSLASHRWLEMPAQRYLRKRLVSKSR
jgi:peptidoglycan/LPS O-acetylase OafA/YrhL